MLSDVQIRGAKALPGKTLKLSDSGGLQLWVTPTGSKLWNVAYRLEGKQRKLSLGAYPAVGLKAARDHRDAAKRLLAAGVDPGQQKKADATAKANTSATTFDLIADELIAKKEREKTAPATMRKIRWLIGIARPKLGKRPIGEITASEVLAVLRVPEARGHHETAIRLRSTIGEAFRYAVATDRASNDPTYALRGALTDVPTKHRAAITEPKPFGALLRAIAGYEGTPEVRIALQLAALTFPRPGELRAATWSEFDFDAAVWSIPAERMKMRRPHRVPLASQTVALLRQLQTLTGHGALLFPSIGGALRPMSENTLNAALRRLGFTSEEMTAHGFRASASSMLNECGQWNPDAIEAQLAHEDADEVRKAYHRALYWDERVRMMTWWADQIDEMRDGRNVVALRA